MSKPKDIYADEKSGTVRTRISKTIMDLDSLEAEYGIPDETITNDTGDIIFRSQIRDFKTGSYLTAPTKVQASILFGELSKVLHDGKQIAYVYAYGRDLSEILRTIHRIRLDTPNFIISETYEHVAIKSNFEVRDVVSDDIVNEYPTYLHGLRIELGIQ